MPYCTCVICRHPFYSPTVAVRPGGPALLGVACVDCRIQSNLVQVKHRDREAELFQACKEKLQARKSICLGEKHEDGGLARRMLIRYMARFAQLGVRCLGIEAPNVALEFIGGDLGCITQLTKGRNPGLGEVAVAAERCTLAVQLYDYDITTRSEFDIVVGLAKTHGISGIPSKFSGTVPKYGGWDNTYRCALMNYYAPRHLTGFTGKLYIILVGADHLVSSRGHPPLQDLLSDKPAPIDATKF